MGKEKLGEFELIEKLAKQLGPIKNKDIIGIGDDCAALPHAKGVQLLTCDIAIAGRHFLPGKTPMADVGWRIATANASDVAACGGMPMWALVSLGLPEDHTAREVEALYAGISQATRHYGFSVLGGNTSMAGEWMIDLFMVGEAPRFVSRSAAKPGHLIAVSGHLGGAEAGRHLFDEYQQTPANSDEKALIQRHLRPKARTDLVPVVQRCGGAAIDISDGLAAELGHLADKSMARLEIESALIPIMEGLSAWGRHEEREPLEIALHSGEEYQLLITLPPDAQTHLAGSDFTIIGKVKAGQGVFMDGKPLPPIGWDHLKPSE